MGKLPACRGLEAAWVHHGLLVGKLLASATAPPSARLVRHVESSGQPSWLLATPNVPVRAGL
jgi:hypothetical protein